MQLLQTSLPTLCLPIRKGMWIPSSQWKKGFQISPHRHSCGRLCFEPWSKRATLILKVWKPQDLTGESTHSVIVKTVMPCLTIKCSEHKCRVYPNTVSSRLKGKLCKKAISMETPRFDWGIYLLCDSEDSHALFNCKVLRAQMQSLAKYGII